MMWSYRRWLSRIVLLAFTVSMTGCFKDPPAADSDPESCDVIGIKNLAVVPPTPIVGTEFELQWTRVGAVHIVESGPGFSWIPGNSNVSATLESVGGFSAEIDEPFDYNGFGNGEGEFEQPDSLGVADLVPAFADLAPGEYTASLEVIGSNAPVCPPQGGNSFLSVQFTIAAGSSCVAPDITFLDLAVRDLTIASETTTIEWAVDYNFQSAVGADPGFDVTLDHEVTVTNADTGELLGSTTVSTAGSILPGDSVTEMLQLMSILDQPPQSAITIQVEVIPGQADAECGGSGEDFTANNTIEITTQL